MSKFLRTFLNWLLEIRNSIAFYPSIIASGMLILAVLSLNLEQHFLTQEIAAKLPVLIISDPDTARSILNTLIGGIISLMVFSFSMVMILLSQASSNYSPRLLPGLITNKEHQMVLGIYLGTILFCILCSINVLPEEGSYSVPAISILLSIIFGVVCLAMFIYFIHSMSESIQINNIVKKLHDQGIKDVEQLLECTATVPNFVSSLTITVKNPQSGYLVSVSIDAVLATAKANDLIVELIAPMGLFIFKGQTVFLVSRPINAEIENQLCNCLHISDNETIRYSHYTSIKNTVEVALKAMSPGINDPGTALLANNYLFLLLAKRMQLEDVIFYSNEDEEDDKVRLSHVLVRFKDLLYNNFAELRTYVAHDQMIVHQLVDGLDYLLQQPSQNDSYYQAIETERKILVEASKQEFQLNYDKAQKL